MHSHVVCMRAYAHARLHPCINICMDGFNDGWKDIHTSCLSLLNTSLEFVMQNNNSHEDVGHSPQLGKMDIRSHLAAGRFERCPVE